MAEIIVFSERAPKARARRAEAATRVTGTDFFWLAAVCCWPISLSFFAVQAGIEALRSGDRR